MLNYCTNLFTIIPKHNPDSKLNEIANLFWESLVDIVDYLIEQKANVNKQDTTGSSPLHIAAGEGSIDVITSLINGGADVNLIDNDVFPILNAFTFWVNV